MGIKTTWTNKETTTSESVKEGKTHDLWGWKDQNKIADKSDNTTRRDKSNNIGKRRKTHKLSGQGQAIYKKQNLLR